MHCNMDVSLKSSWFFTLLAAEQQRIYGDWRLDASSTNISSCSRGSSTCYLTTQLKRIIALAQIEERGKRKGHKTGTNYLIVATLTEEVYDMEDTLGPCFEVSLHHLSTTEYFVK